MFRPKKLEWVYFSMAQLKLTQSKTGILYTVCPGSSDPFYIASLLYKMGHYFLDILYIAAQNENFYLATELLTLLRREDLRSREVTEVAAVATGCWVVLESGTMFTAELAVWFPGSRSTTEGSTTGEPKLVRFAAAALARY